MELSFSLSLPAKAPGDLIGTPRRPIGDLATSISSIQTRTPSKDKWSPGRFPSIEMRITLRVESDRVMASCGWMNHRSIDVLCLALLEGSSSCVSSEGIHASSDRNESRRTSRGKQRDKPTEVRDRSAVSIDRSNCRRRSESRVKDVLPKCLRLPSVLLDPRLPSPLGFDLFPRLKWKPFVWNVCIRRNSSSTTKQLLVAV